MRRKKRRQKIATDLSPADSSEVKEESTASTNGRNYQSVETQDLNELDARQGPVELASHIETVELPSKRDTVELPTSCVV
jgi:hypothetical protein